MHSLEMSYFLLFFTLSVPQTNKPRIKSHYRETYWLTKDTGCTLPFSLNQQKEHAGADSLYAIPILCLV